MANKYLDLKEKHAKEVSDFPMMFSFNKEQFKEGMAKLGLKETDTHLVVTSHVGGVVVRKTDSKALTEMFANHRKETKEAMQADLTGEGYIFDMFNYELANHEYCVTGDDWDTLRCLGLSQEDIVKSEPMTKGYNKAVQCQYDNSNW